jgi:hypothetical protein
MLLVHDTRLIVRYLNSPQARYMSFWEYLKNINESLLFFNSESEIDRRIIGELLMRG